LCPVHRPHEPNDDLGKALNHHPQISIVIPTYRRSDIVLDTISQFRKYYPEQFELIIVDQTADLPPAAAAALAKLDTSGSIRWLQLPKPSIPAAMNCGLLAAKGEAVLFLDDDIQLNDSLLSAHLAAQKTSALVAGQVLQPGEFPTRLRPGQSFLFRSDTSRWIREFMGGNFSVNRAKALELGGFDENFVGAGYRFEAEFANRFVKKFGKILFTPEASIRHLQLAAGGTRAHGHHLRTAGSAHSVGAYYYLLRVRPRRWWRKVLLRPARAIRTRHHLQRPWWIPVTLLAELRGFFRAIWLLARGPKLIDPDLAVARGKG
jgi:glycosyltransferase involved in cell wall biosynthesis